MDSGTIIHPGVIRDIKDDKLYIQILAKSACSTCHASGACSVADIEEKIIEVEIKRPKDYKHGEQVMVKLDESLGRKAVMMGYVIPLILLVFSVIIFLTLLKHEGLAALLSLSMLVPYYLILYLFRDRLKKEFRFRVETGEQ